MFCIWRRRTRRPTMKVSPVHGSKLFFDPANRKAHLPSWFSSMPRLESYWSSVSRNRENAARNCSTHIAPDNPALQARIEPLKNSALKPQMGPTRICCRFLPWAGWVMSSRCIVFRNYLSQLCADLWRWRCWCVRQRSTLKYCSVFPRSQRCDVDPRHSRATVEKLKTLKVAVRQYKNILKPITTALGQRLQEPDFELDVCKQQVIYIRIIVGDIDEAWNRTLNLHPQYFLNPNLSAIFLDKFPVTSAEARATLTPGACTVQCLSHFAEHFVQLLLIHSNTGIGNTNFSRLRH